VIFKYILQSLKASEFLLSSLGKRRAVQHWSSSWKIRILGRSCSHWICLCISTTHSDPFEQPNRSNPRTSGGRAGGCRRRGTKDAL